MENLLIKVAGRNYMLGEASEHIDTAILVLKKAQRLIGQVGTDEQEHEVTEIIARLQELKATLSAKPNSTQP